MVVPADMSPTGRGSTQITDLQVLCTLDVNIQQYEHYVAGFSYMCPIDKKHCDTPPLAWLDPAILTAHTIGGTGIFIRC
jgi:hypothetical protein